MSDKVIWGPNGEALKAVARVIDGPVYDPDTEAYAHDPRIEEALQFPKDSKFTLRMRESSIRSAGRPRLLEVGGLTAKSKGVAIGGRLVEGARKKRESILKRAASRIGLRETDVFAQDLDNVASVFSDNPEQEFLQILGGPFSRQLYLSSKLEMYAKCFWEQSHMPLFHRACVALAEYVVGRGVKFKARDPKFQIAWDKYRKRDNFYRRLWWAVYDMAWQGEVFWRVFVGPTGDVTVRELDGSTIWEAITDPEDTEVVHGYWQQYPGPYNIYSMIVAGQLVPYMKYLIRIIPADEVIHARINDTYGEKFGRSDGFSGLGWSKRIRDYGAGVTISTMYENAFAWLVKLKGDSADVQSLINSGAFSKPPKPGSMIVTNEAVDWTPASAKGAGGRGSAKSEIMLDLVRMLGASFGIPVEYLGWTERGGTKASAISKTEPFAKHVEMRQFWTETQLLMPFVEKLGEALVRTGQLPAGTSFEGEWTWPEAAPEDKDARVGRIAFAADRGWIDEEREATMGAAELDITDYDYVAEKAKIDAQKAKRAAAGMDAMNGAAATLANRRTPMGSQDRAETKDTDSKLKPQVDLPVQGGSPGATRPAA